MNVDEILRRIGEFGLYQKVFYIIVNLLGVTHGIRMLITVFMLYTPLHRCALPVSIYPNDTYEIQSDYHAKLVSQFIPNNTNDDEDTPYDQCHIYASGGDNNLSFGTTERPMQGCGRWVYDRSVFDNTAIVEFNLVCDDSLLGSHSQTSQMAGFLFGVLFFGAIGDKWGRKTALCLGVWIYLASGLGLSWSPLANYYVFVLLRFVNGATSAGAYTAACVLSVELVGPNKRLWVGVLIHTVFAVGGVVLDFIGYFVRDWFLINIISTSPIILALSFWWVLPESPRWLVKKGRLKEAELILRKIAKYNGKVFPESLLKGVADTVNHSDTDVRGVAKASDEPINNGSKTVVGGAKGGDEIDNEKGRGTLRDFLRMFTYRILFIRNFILFINWFAVAMTYYGLSFAADQLAGGTLFTNFLLSMAMDFPATALVLLLLDRWGRRMLHSISMIMGAVACLIGVLTTMVAPNDYQWVTVAVAMVGKMGSTAGFILVYIYSSELFPTTVRSAGMGVSSASARLGSILSYYVQHWSLEMGGDFGNALPLLVFGAFSLLGGLLTPLLPETLHKDLPDTIEDGLAFGRNPEKDERQDPVKVMEVYSIGDVEVNMERFETADVLMHGNDTHKHDNDTKEQNGLTNLGYVDDQKVSEDGHIDVTHKFQGGVKEGNGLNSSEDSEIDKRVNFADPSQTKYIPPKGNVGDDEHGDLKDRKEGGKETSQSAHLQERNENDVTKCVHKSDHLQFSEHL